MCKRVIAGDEHQHFDRVLWLPDRFLRLQIKTRNVLSGCGYYFDIRKGYQHGPVGTRPYARSDFDLLALVVLPEGVIRFTAGCRPSHLVTAAEIPALRQCARASLDDALRDLGLPDAIPDPALGAAPDTAA